MAARSSPSPPIWVRAKSWNRRGPRPNAAFARWDRAHLCTFTLADDGQIIETWTGTSPWGGDISDAQRVLRTNPEIMLWPSLALSVCVLSFMLLGDAVRDAPDPKLR